MRWPNSPGRYFLSLLFFCVVLCGNAHAYIDPGTGSFFLQAVLAVAMGAMFVVKPYFKRIVAFFKKLFFRKD